jgi:hypothetical protein
MSREPRTAGRLRRLEVDEAIRVQNSKRLARAAEAKQAAQHSVAAKLFAGTAPHQT